MMPRLPTSRIVPFAAASVVLFSGVALAQPVFQPQFQNPPAPPGPPAPAKPTPIFPAYLPMFIAIIAVFVAQQRQRQQEEEEEVSTHITDPAAVEYKIVRSTMGAFKKPDKFRAMLDEEARAGWELFEKLDDGRVRLRRPLSCRERDAELQQDPYRIKYGGGEATIVIAVIIGIVAVMAIVVAVLIAIRP